jgi:hypothetical protein
MRIKDMGIAKLIMKYFGIKKILKNIIYIMNKIYYKYIRIKDKTINLKEILKYKIFMKRNRAK